MAELKDVLAGIKVPEKKHRKTFGSPRRAPAYDPRYVVCVGCLERMYCGDCVTHNYLKISECSMCAAETVSWRAFEEELMWVKGADPTPGMTKEEIAVMSVNVDKGVITLKCSWNPFFGEQLKIRLKPSERRWNPDNKVWEVHPNKAKEVEQLLKEFYGGVRILGTKPAGGSKFERLLQIMHKEDKQAVYRLLALKYHPDKKSGSHEVMTLINEIFKTP